MTLIPLTLYSLHLASATLSSAERVVVPVGAPGISNRSTKCGTSSGYSQLCGQGTGSAWGAFGSIQAPNGKGFCIDPADFALAGLTIPAGIWTPMVRAKCSVNTIVIDLYMPIYVYDTSAHTYTLLGTPAFTGQTLTTTGTLYRFLAASLSAHTFGSTETLYYEIWGNITANNTGDPNATITIYVSSDSANGDPSGCRLATPGYNSASGPFTYYLSPTGSDSNAGTSSDSPWQTLSKAAAVMRAGDTAMCAPGNYTGGVSFGFAGTALAPITLKSTTTWKGGAQPVSQGAKIIEGTTGLGTFALALNGDYITLDSFEVTAPDCQWGVQLQGNYGICQNCWIHDIANTLGTSVQGYGVGTFQLNYHGWGCQILSNRVERCGPKSGGAIVLNEFFQTIYVQCDNANASGIAENNLCIQSSGWGIQLYHNPNNHIVSNNTCISCLEGGLLCSGDTGAGYLADSNTIQNNIFMNCGQPTWQVAIDSASNACGTHNIFRNNLAYYPGGTPVETFTPAGSGPVQKSINDILGFNPDFINYLPDGTGDYHLSASSPCIGTGFNTLAPVTDFDGNARPFGLNVDSGCFEWQGPSGTPVSGATGTPVKAYGRDGLVIGRGH